MLNQYLSIIFIIVADFEKLQCLSSLKDISRYKS